MLRHFGLLLAVLCLAKATHIDDEFWTVIGDGGVINTPGRSVADFVSDFTLGGRDPASYIGFWIARDKYKPGQQYEAFGNVFIDERGRVCGRFPGYRHENAHSCGGFRVLSKGMHSKNVPFHWVSAAHATEDNTIGFFHHRIAKILLNSTAVFGDVNINQRDFKGVDNYNQYTDIHESDTHRFNNEVFVLTYDGTYVPFVPQPVVDHPRRAPIRPTNCRYSDTEWKIVEGDDDLFIDSRGSFETIALGYVPKTARKQYLQLREIKRTPGSNKVTEYIYRIAVVHDIYKREYEEFPSCLDGTNYVPPVVPVPDNYRRPEPQPPVNYYLNDPHDQ